MFENSSTLAFHNCRMYFFRTVSHVLSRFFDLFQSGSALYQRDQSEHGVGVTVEPHTDRVAT